MTANECTEQLDTRKLVKQALEQPADEPVAWIHEWDDGERIPLLHNETRDNDKPVSVRPLVYGDTRPQPTAWVGLTDEEFEAARYWVDDQARLWKNIEAKLKEKNSG